MLEDPGLDHDALTRSLRVAYGITASRFTFMPAHDARSASYAVTDDGDAHFLKVHFAGVDRTSLEVPAALLEAGVDEVVAPLRTGESALWAELDGLHLVLYPFVRGRNAMEAGLSEDQWRRFGKSLRAVHESGLERRLADRLPAETFSSEAAAAALRMVNAADPHAPAAASRRLASLFAHRREQIDHVLRRADDLAARLRQRSFRRVLCHADIHAANILVTDAGGICMVDWDGPMLAPRERDLLFVVGSRIARDVEPHEERWFFEAYGDVPIDAEAIIYYRYERILEDIAEFGASIFLDTSQTEGTRQAQFQLVASFFEPGGIIESAERV